MGIVNIIKNIKQVHKEDIVLMRVGKFYYAYGKDAYILSYLFQYKLTLIKEEKIYSCAFPQQSFQKIIAQLEHKKINYIVVDRRNSYDVEEKVDHKNLNCYQKYLEQAKKYVDMKRRIDTISEYLLQHIFEDETNDTMKKMEEIINERRKV